MTYIRHLDDEFDFGKFKGCTFAEVLQDSPDYLTWVVDNVAGSRCVFDDSVMDEVSIMFPRFKVTQEFENMRCLRLEEFEEIADCVDDKYRHDYNVCFYDDRDGRTYGRYAGSYAQDEMGYSDDDIDTIFDGEPDAYWNID